MKSHYLKALKCNHVLILLLPYLQYLLTSISYPLREIYLQLFQIYLKKFRQVLREDCRLLCKLKNVNRLSIHKNNNYCLEKKYYLCS